MRPAEEIEKFIKNVPLETKAERDREVLDDALRALKESKERDKRQPDIWKSIVRSRMTKLAAAASIILAVLIGIGTFDRRSAWAEVLRALEQVDQVYIEQTLTYPDDTQTRSRYWFRKPDCLREERPGRVVIDDGQNRLTINRKTQEAQFEDSWAEYKPVGQVEMFEQIHIFRGHETEGLTATKLAEQSNEGVSVFHLDYINLHSRLIYQGKAWVDSSTMLPMRVKIEIRDEPKEGEPKELEVKCDYSSISDTLFEPMIPNGYAVLPRKRTQAITGKVLDVDGSPLGGATVHLVDKHLRFLRNVETNSAGEFVFDLPPSKVHWVGLPMFMRAVPPDDADRVAWTIIEDPAKKKDQGVTIPGETGYVEMSGPLFVQCVNGVVLRMESAGTITGCVTDMVGEPLSGVEVKIEGRPYAAKTPGMPLFAEFGFIGRPLGGEGPRGELTARTDEQGRYAVTNVPKLSKWNWYQISAGSKPGFSSNYTRIERTSWKTDVERADIELYRTGLTVYGTLVDNCGQALEMRRIFGRVGNRDFCDTITDEQGRFVLEDCPVSPELKIKAELSRNTWIHLGKEKRLSYTYYPNVIVPIDYQDGKMEYKVNLVAEKPEITIELEVKNTEGEPVVHYPTELQGASVSTSPEWQEYGRFTQRTDLEGYCKFTKVPNTKDLRLIVGRAHIWNDLLSKKQAEKAKKENAKYRWVEVPVDAKPDQKEYRIEVTVLTEEEFEARQ